MGGFQQKKSLDLRMVSKGIKYKIQRSHLMRIYVGVLATWFYLDCSLDRSESLGRPEIHRWSSTSRMGEIPLWGGGSTYGWPRRRRHPAPGVSLRQIKGTLEDASLIKNCGGSFPRLTNCRGGLGPKGLQWRGGGGGGYGGCLRGPCTWPPTLGVACWAVPKRLVAVDTGGLPGPVSLALPTGEGWTSLFTPLGPVLAWALLGLPPPWCPIMLEAVEAAMAAAMDDDREGPSAG